MGEAGPRREGGGWRDQSPPGMDGSRAPHLLGFVHDAAPAAVCALAQHHRMTGRQWLSGCREVIYWVAMKIALQWRKSFSIQDFNAKSHCEF